MLGSGTHTKEQKRLVGEEMQFIEKMNVCGIMDMNRSKYEERK